MFFHIRQYLNFSVQKNFLLRFFIQVAIVLIAIAFNTENKNTAVVFFYEWEKFTLVTRKYHASVRLKFE